MNNDYIIDKLIKENDSLKKGIELKNDELKQLKEAILNLYNIMVSLEIINEYEVKENDIEVI